LIPKPEHLPIQARGKTYEKLKTRTFMQGGGRRS
jgi:hypothetical protein